MEVESSHDMHLRHRRLIGGLLFVVLVSSHIAEAELTETERLGPNGPTTHLTLLVYEKFNRHAHHNGGSLFLMCEENSNKVDMTLVLLHYRFRNSHTDQCGDAGINIEFDSHPWISQSWLRPTAANELTTSVTTQVREGSSCQNPVTPSPLGFVYEAIRTKYVDITISDSKKDDITDAVFSPKIRFDMEHVRHELVEFYNRCRKKQ